MDNFIDSQASPESVLDRTVSVFRNAKATDPVDDVALTVILDRIRTGAYRAEVDQVLDAAPELQQEVKARVLSAFTPSGRFGRRSREGLLEHSGVVVLDIDDKTDAEGKKAELARDPHVLAAFRSPRGGVKVLVPVVVIDGETGELRNPETAGEHKAVMASAFGHFTHMDPDPSGTDVARLCYFSFDPDPYVNEGAVPLEVEAGTTPKTGEGGPDEAGPASQAKPAGRAAFDDVIPHGKQYSTIGQAAGALRRLGFGKKILLSVARTLYDKHLEHPNNWEKVERYVLDIAAKPVEPHTSARRWRGGRQEAMARNGLAGHGQDASVLPMPWRPFPADALPQAARDYVVAQAAAIGVDPRSSPSRSSAVLAAAVGNSFRVRAEAELGRDLGALDRGRGGLREREEPGAPRGARARLRARTRRRRRRTRREAVAYNALSKDAEAGPRGAPAPPPPRERHDCGEPHRRP